MLTKLIGSVLIFVASCGIGYTKSQEMKLHLEELEELKKMFCLLKSELQYTRAPFSEVFEKIGQKTREPYQTWMLSLCKRLNKNSGAMFWEIWCVSIADDLQGSKLTEEEKEELKQVGKNLEYIESLELYIEQMEYKIKNVREGYRSKRKLCQSLGIMGGIFLVILLL